MMKVDISGLDALSRDMGGAGKQMKAAAQAKGATAAERIAADMQSRVAVDRGNLRSSIRTEPAKDGGTLIRAGGTTSTMKPTARGTEFDEALSVEYGNAHSRAEPFFNNTLDDHRDGVERDMGEAADDAAGKAVR